ncbi:MAG: hypothetical protein ACR2JH_11615 [Solirubrobacteraceae bacterium]
MPWSSLIRAVGAKRHLRELPAPHGRSTTLGEAERSHRTMMGLDVSPVHGRHCICNRCAMLTERIRIRDAA